MKLLTRTEFMAAPEGTIYFEMYPDPSSKKAGSMVSKFSEPHSGMYRKEGNSGTNDWVYTKLHPWMELPGGNHGEKLGYCLDNDTARDGGFDEDVQFLIMERADLLILIAMLTNTDDVNEMATYLEVENYVK